MMKAEEWNMKKWWKEEADGRPLLKAFALLSASDSEIDQCCGCLLLVDFNLSSLLMIMVNILPYFQIWSQILTDDQRFLPDTVYDVVAKIVQKFWLNHQLVCEFAVLSALWTFEINGFLQSLYMGDQESRHYLPSVDESMTLVWLADPFAFALFLGMFGRMLLNLLKT